MRYVPFARVRWVGAFWVHSLGLMAAKVGVEIEIGNGLVSDDLKGYII